MVRVKHAVSGHERKKKILKRAKGQFGHRSKRYAQAIKSVIKGLQYSFRDRKAKKRSFRALWIVRINAACREAGISYSRFIKGLSVAKVELDRRLIAEIAVSSPETFTQLVKTAQEANAAAPTTAAKKKTATTKKA